MHMIDLTLSMPQLITHAESQGRNHNRDEDLGYALHGWLTEVLGNKAPKPFRLMDQRDERLRVLGYAGEDFESLRHHIEQFASPVAARVVDWPRCASKDMSGIVWQTGQKLGFEVRLCPVVRGKAGERDAFLASLPEGQAPAEQGRADVYHDWLVKRLNEAVELDSLSFALKSFRLTSVWRQGRKAGGVRPGRQMSRPDALVTGQFTIRDPDLFPDLLSSGIGRHKAFGYGMLLIRPA